MRERGGIFSARDALPAVRRASDPEGFSTTHRYYKYWENLVRLMLLEAATERQKRTFLIRVEDVRGKVIAMADVQTNSRDHGVCI